MKLVHDTVFNNDKPIFLCNEDIKPPHLIYFLRNFQRKTMAVVHFEMQDSVLKSSVSFPFLNLRYNVYYPKMEIVTLLESFVRNKIIVNGTIDTIGLKAYCKQRQILMTSMTQRRTIRPTANDSSLGERAKKDYQSQIPIEIINSSYAMISINLGTPSNNRIQSWIGHIWNKNPISISRNLLVCPASIWIAEVF